MIFKIFLEDETSPNWDALFADAEKKILADPQARQELAQNHEISQPTVRRVLGTSYGVVYLTILFNKKYGDTLQAARSLAGR